LLIPKIAIDSSVEVFIDFDTTYSKTYELIDEYDSDGTLFYSVYIKDVGHLDYRGHNIFNAKETYPTAGEYTKERIAICDF